MHIIGKNIKGTIFIKYKDTLNSKIAIGKIINKFLTCCPNKIYGNQLIIDTLYDNLYKSKLIITNKKDFCNNILSICNETFIKNYRLKPKVIKNIT